MSNYPAITESNLNQYQYFLEQLIKLKLEEGEFHIGISELEEQKCAIVEADQYNDDQSLILACDQYGKCLLYMSFWDIEGELQERRVVLEEADYQFIPAGLLTIMRGVAKSFKCSFFALQKLDNS
jgi:hypothetical protein